MPLLCGGGATGAFIGGTAWHTVTGLRGGLGRDGEVGKLEAGLGVSMDLKGLLFLCGEAMPPHNALGAGTGRGVACAVFSPHLHAQTMPCEGNRTVDKGEARGRQARSSGSEQKKIFIK